MNVLRIFTAAFLCSVIVASGCAPSTEPSTEEEKKTIRIATLSAEPFLYLDEENQPAGLEFDLLDGFAAAQNLKIEWIWAADFAEMLSILERGEADLAASGISINVERQKQFDFSEPYFPALAVLVERRGHESETTDDLQGSRVLVLPGTTHEKILRGIQGVEVDFGENAAEMFSLVDQGKAAAAAVDSTDYLWYADSFQSLTATLSLSEREFYGFALQRGSPLKAPLDVHLQEVKVSGRYREILRSAYGKWGVELIDEMSEDFLEKEFEPELESERD